MLAYGSCATTLRKRATQRFAYNDQSTRTVVHDLREFALYVLDASDLDPPLGARTMADFDLRLATYMVDVKG
eukprot:1176948-Prorocentrum_minimum.AAC.1